MINEEFDETQDDTLETVLEDTTEDTDAVDEKDTVEYWKAEALKNKAILERNKSKKADAKPASKKSDDFDYGEFAFLAQKGIESDDDIAFVKERMKDSGKSLRDTLNASWFKAEFDERKALNAAQAATPSGKRSSALATDSVDYWMSKPFSEVPQDMKAKVVEARRKKETSKGVFYNS